MCLLINQQLKKIEIKINGVHIYSLVFVPDTHVLSRAMQLQNGKESYLVVFIVVNSCTVYPTLFIILGLQNSESKPRLGWECIILE